MSNTIFFYKTIKKEKYTISRLYIDKTNKSINALDDARNKKLLLKQKGLDNQGDKDTRSLARTKARVKELLDCNLNWRSQFVTLTYAENMLDYVKAKKDFTKMIDVINKRLVRQGLDKLKYINIIEHQKRGSIHFHLITFNHDFIDYKDFWKYGFSQTKTINDPNHSKLTNYFANYLMKRNKGYKGISKGVRTFSYSQNLKKYTIQQRKNKEILDETKAKILVSMFDGAFSFTSERLHKNN